MSILALLVSYVWQTYKKMEQLFYLFDLCEIETIWLNKMTLFNRYKINFTLIWKLQRNMVILFYLNSIVILFYLTEKTSFCSSFPPPPPYPKFLKRGAGRKLFPKSFSPQSISSPKYPSNAKNGINYFIFKFWYWHLPPDVLWYFCKLIKRFIKQILQYWCYNVLQIYNRTVHSSQKQERVLPQKLGGKMRL